jgi:hypothetical protein
MFKPQEALHITVQRKAMTGRMEAFHAPAISADQETLVQPTFSAAASIQPE